MRLNAWNRPLGVCTRPPGDIVFAIGIRTFVTQQIFSAVCRERAASGAMELPRPRSEPQPAPATHSSPPLTFPAELPNAAGGDAAGGDAAGRNTAGRNADCRYAVGRNAMRPCQH